MVTGGSDTEGCGREEHPCQTLRFLLLQVNRNHSTPSTGGDTGNQISFPPSNGDETANETYFPPSHGDETANQTQLPPSTESDISNQTNAPPSRELRIITDKSLRIDQRIAVSTIFFTLY